MTIEEVITKIQLEDKPLLRFRRSFSQNPIATTILVQLNKLMVTEPDTVDAVVAFLLYPVIQWQMQAKEVDTVMAHLCADDPEMQRLKSVQKILMLATGEAPAFLLENRKIHFAACNDLVNLVQEITTIMARYPGGGPTMGLILQALMGNMEVTATAYSIRKNVPKLFIEIAHQFGPRLETALDNLLRPDVFEDQEMSLIYHNTELLLNEYNRIAWRAQNSDDKAMKLLGCKSEKEMLAITQKDSSYMEAYSLIQYMKFINGSIELVKSYPSKGVEMYNILKLHLQANAASLPSCWAAKKLNISPSVYSVGRKKAFAILSAILWGCDCDMFVRMLLD